MHPPINLKGFSNFLQPCRQDSEICAVHCATNAVSNGCPVNFSETTCRGMRTPGGRGKRYSTAMTTTPRPHLHLARAPTQSPPSQPTTTATLHKETKQSASFRMRGCTLPTRMVCRACAAQGHCTAPRNYLHPSNATTLLRHPNRAARATTSLKLG